MTEKRDASQPIECEIRTVPLDISKEAEAAANWWKNVLRNPKFDNGADDVPNQMAQMLALMSNAKQTVEDEALDNFAVILKQKIIDKFATDARSWQMVFAFGTDYHPDRILSESAAEAGLKGEGMTTFPWKTIMWVGKDCVKVGYGYRAAPVVIYGEDKEI